MTTALIEELVKALEDVIASSRQQADYITYIIPVKVLRDTRAVIDKAKLSLPDVRAARSDSWQPIATAPKDGTKILLYFPDRGGWITLAYWDHRTWTNGDTWESQFTDQKPTHWQPLPSPPSKQEGASE